MPSDEISKPPHQHSADTKPALRGPERSSQPPNSAADEPRSTKKSVYTQPRSEMRQSQVRVNSAWPRVRSGHDTDFSTPSAFESGSQNTLKPYAIPMHR